MVRLPEASPPETPCRAAQGDRKSTRLNSSHTVIYTLSLHDALPISKPCYLTNSQSLPSPLPNGPITRSISSRDALPSGAGRSEEHTSELQSHSDLHSFPTRRSSDLETLLFDEFAVVAQSFAEWSDYPKHLLQRRLAERRR